MPPRKMGTFVVNGVRLIYDGTADAYGRDAPIKVCPDCPEEKRVTSYTASAILRGTVSGRCRSCAGLKRWREKPPTILRTKKEDERCENGAVVHWSQRIEGTSRHKDRVPVTYICGHTLTTGISNAYLVRTLTGRCKKCAWKNDMRGAKHPRWKGGRYRSPDGYIKININGLDSEDRILAKPMCTDSRHHIVLEHRLIMARKIGRPLKRGEIVHHLNGVRDDNRIENLELVTGNADHRGAENTLIHRLRIEIARLQALLDEAGSSTS